MTKYTREENGVRISLEIENETYSSKEVIEIIEKINTTVEIKELKPTAPEFDDLSKYNKKDY